MTESADAASDGDALSPAEQAYFDSRGNSTDGLASEPPSTGAAAEGTASAADDAASKNVAAINRGLTPNRPYSSTLTGEPAAASVAGPFRIQRGRYTYGGVGCCVQT